MQSMFWSSLRSRILLLVVLILLFLGGSAASFFTYLRSSEMASIQVSERHLIQAAASIAKGFTAQSTRGISLRDAMPPMPPPPPLPPGPNVRPPPPAPPPPDALTRLMAAALRREEGIEGGFYSMRSDQLVGYAFPTHEGPGPDKEMPQRERPTIESLARSAVAGGAQKTLVFRGAHDGILFAACPVYEAASEGGSEITGAVWLMQRLPGVDAGQNWQLLAGSAGFAIAALISALLAFFVIREVRSGVGTVLARLGTLEAGFSTDVPPLREKPQLEEFDRVLRGVDRLAAALKQKIESERMLESELRHRERLSALGQFAAGIAHELRNPLGTIRLRTQMWQRSTDPAASARSGEVILEEIDRLDAIIGRLLYFSRPIHLHRNKVDVDALAASAVANWVERAAALGVQITCEAGSEGVIDGDGSQVLQVLDNLIENAIHASSAAPSGARSVVVATGRRSGTVEIVVTDRGMGLSDDALIHALDPFFTTKESGTGLGLSISFEIAAAHGGSLSLTNSYERGAIAKVELPLAEDQQADLVRERALHG